MASQVLDGGDEWKKRWSVHIQCAVCRTAFKVESSFVHVSLQRVNETDRMLVVQVPESCPNPKCRGLQVVSDGGDVEGISREKDPGAGG